MCAKMQMRSRSVEDEPRFVVGMDAHARKLAVSVWDWTDRLNACLHREIKCVDVDAMVKTYERHIDLDSITVIEASTNSAALKRRLEEAGFRAEVVRSDTIADKERRRKVCDIQDARNLALAYIKGDVRDFVWTPSDEYSEYRDVMFAYRDTVKELVRTSNRIWSVCSRKGCALPARGASAKAESLRKTIEGTGICGFAKEQLETLLEDYERLQGRREALSRRMAETVLSKPDMLRLMQLQGVNYKGAFAISAAVEDVGRFPTAAKLSAYCGFAPVLDTSGGEEEKARRRGGTGKPLDGEAPRRGGARRRQALPRRGRAVGADVLRGLEARQARVGDDQQGQAAQQGRVRNRPQARPVRLPHHARRSDAEPRQRRVLQAQDAQAAPGNRSQADARARAWNEGAFRLRSGETRIRLVAGACRTRRRGISGSRVELTQIAARARFRSSSARARIHGNTGALPQPPSGGLESP